MTDTHLLSGIPDPHSSTDVDNLSPAILLLTKGGFIFVGIAYRAADIDSCLSGRRAESCLVCPRLGNGRQVLDEPTALPDGTVVDLVADDDVDDLIDTYRAAQARSWEVNAGRLDGQARSLTNCARDGEQSGHHDT
jgi:hypothetical protein